MVECTGGSLANGLDMYRAPVLIGAEFPNGVAVTVLPHCDLVGADTESGLEGHCGGQVERRSVTEMHIAESVQVIESGDETADGAVGVVPVTSRGLLYGSSDHH